MHRHVLPLSLVFIFSSAFPALAQVDAAAGLRLYETNVSSAKSQAQPEDKFTQQQYDGKQALMISQGAIGNQLWDHTFLNSSGRTVRLSDYRGKPLVINMIYTHCPWVCATTTRNLGALKLSRDALGADSFGVLTIGFDTENDTPEEMEAYANRMEVKLPNWEFVSADAKTIAKLSNELGFVFFPSPGGGFEHITQTTFVDGDGKVNFQIYGEEFGNKTLLEPLKNMIFNTQSTDPIYNIKTAESGLAGIVNSVKLFCTVYDTKTGKYTLDYSFFYGIGLGILMSLFITWWIVSEYRRSPKRKHPGHA